MIDFLKNYLPLISVFTISGLSVGFYLAERCLRNIPNNRSLFAKEVYQINKDVEDTTFSRFSKKLETMSPDEEKTVRKFLVSIFASQNGIKLSLIQIKIESSRKSFFTIDELASLANSGLVSSSLPLTAAAVSGYGNSFDAKTYFRRGFRANFEKPLELMILQPTKTALILASRAKNLDKEIREFDSFLAFGIPYLQLIE